MLVILIQRFGLHFLERIGSFNEFSSGIKMDNHNHTLLFDDCPDCHYISNAFTLLRLPLKKITVPDLIERPDIVLDALSILICKQIENQHGKLIHDILNSSRGLLISFNDPAKFAKYNTRPICHLKMPFSKYELNDALSHGIEHHDNLSDPTDFNNPVFERLVGPSENIRNVKLLIKQVADSDSTVLLLGQSGTGKDVIASCIHYLSKRKVSPLVPINCGAIPSELMESELFGHEKGAFTGAVTRRPGRFELADGGTLFLDEIGDMPMPMQVKLLRVIQDRIIDRVGGNASIKVDVRIIAATNKNLAELIQQNKFREDLFYRLNVFPIQVPTLHERRDDIPMLIDFHLDKIYGRIKHRVIFTDNAKEILCNYAWPGNIRELENFLERMVILHRDCVIDEKNLDPQYKNLTDKSTHPLLSNDASFNIKEYMAKIEQQIIQVALDKSNGIITAAAEYLSLGRATLIEKIKKYNLTVKN